MSGSAVDQGEIWWLRNERGREEAELTEWGRRGGAR